MLYNAQGKPIPETAVAAPIPGQSTVWERSDREEYSNIGRGLDPETVDRIMRAADAGDTQEMAALSETIDDRSFSIGAALDVRRAAIAATEWRLVPGDDSAQAEDIATSAEQMLRAIVGTDTLLDYTTMVQMELGSALLPGFACPEIVWADNGERVSGFQSVPARHFTFRETQVPRLITRETPQGMDLPDGKFCLHWHRAKGGAATRGGLVRACAWIRCFESTNYKDLLRFIERYGMPFLVAKVDEQSWKSERSVLKNIVRNFGPDGGAVLSRNSELELLQAGNNLGDVYFRLLDHLRAAAERLVLGQTGTSGEGGWSNNGAQHLVRMDIRASDCGQIAPTVRNRILVHWTAWNYGPKAAVPRVQYDCKPPKDSAAEATVIATLGNAGWDLDPEQVEASTGYKVTRLPTAPQGAQPLPGAAAGVVTEQVQATALNGAQIASLVDILRGAAAGEIPPASVLPILQAAFPALSAQTVSAIVSSLRGFVPASPAPAPGAAPDRLALEAAAPAAPAAGAAPIDPVLDDARADLADAGAVRAWLAPLQRAIEAAVMEPDEDAARRKILALTADLPALADAMDSAEFEAVLQRAIITQAARARAAAAEALDGRGRDTVSLEFDPNQPRDDQGRWTDTGGGGMQWNNSEGLVRELKGDVFRVAWNDGTVDEKPWTGYRELTDAEKSARQAKGQDPDRLFIASHNTIWPGSDRDRLAEVNKRALGYREKAGSVPSHADALDRVNTALADVPRVPEKNWIGGAPSDGVISKPYPHIGIRSESSLRSTADNPMVHIYASPEGINTFAKKDALKAHGATWDGKRWKVRLLPGREKEQIEALAKASGANPHVTFSVPFGQGDLSDKVNRFNRPEFFRDTVSLEFDPNQPRVPAGNPDGGQFTTSGGAVASFRLHPLGDREDLATVENDEWKQFVTPDPTRKGRTVHKKTQRDVIEYGGLKYLTPEGKYGELVDEETAKSYKAFQPQIDEANAIIKGRNEERRAKKIAADIKTKGYSPIAPADVGPRKFPKNEAKAAQYDRIYNEGNSDGYNPYR